LSDRLSDLLGRLTSAEKVAMLHRCQAAVPRLGLAEFRTGTEALHGLAWLGAATVFPQAIGLASTWSPGLVRAVGDAVGDEVRGHHNKQPHDPEGAGLNVWGPVVNLLRDPRWGRNEEGYSEDPYLTGLMATAYASGLRGDHPAYLKTAPVLKHFLAHNNETNPATSNSNLPPRVLHEYELPAFRAAIAAGAAVGLMPSYNLVNGRPAHVSTLLNGVVRAWAPGEILIVGDAGGAANLTASQNYFPSPVEGYTAALKAGLDSFTEDDTNAAPTIACVTEALRRGLLTEADVDRAVRHALAIRFRVGEFDPPERDPYAALTDEVINCPRHRALAREAASQCVVLLQNDPPAAGDGSPLLPLRRVRRTALIGPMADAVYADWYSGTLPYEVTLRDALADRLGSDAIEYVEGADRIALRIGRDGPYLAAVDPVQGGSLRAETRAEAAEDCWFDVLEWGPSMFTFRLASNGALLTASEDGTLLVDEPHVERDRTTRRWVMRWVVRETFRMEPCDGGIRLYHLASDRYVVAADTSSLHAEGGVAEATVFTVEQVVSGVDQVAQAAHDADVVLVALGNNPMIHGRETEDRITLDLPAAQEALARAARAANPRTVLIMTSGYPFAIPWAAEHLHAIVWTAHGGQEAGNGLADVLLGDVDPGGRLTQTWYASTAELPDLFDYDIATTKSTYQHYEGTPLYPFGHGLSYARFAYRNLRLSAYDARPGDEVTVMVDVTNSGDRPGSEVVQLYTRQLRSRCPQPLRRFRGFRRVWLEPGQCAVIQLSLRVADLAFWDVTRGRFVVEEAPHEIMVGRSAADIALSATLSVSGEQIPPRDPYQHPLQASDYDRCDGVDLCEEYREHGDAVVAARPGGWVAFDDVDLGAHGSALGIARVRGHRDRPTTVTVRLDDPIDGGVAAVFQIAPATHRYDWVEVRAEPTQAGGVRDVFAVFDAEDVALSRLLFASA